jgi:hypothetical protein
MKTIDEIQDAMQTSGPISSSHVKKWAAAPSLDVQGALTDLIFEHGRRIDPPLTKQELYRVVEDYYRECLIRDIKDSDYAPNRHIAGYEFVGWFKALWQDPAVPREYIVHLKEMLRELCVQGKVSRDEIVTAVLEHLFENPALQEFFADWKSDPELAEAFALAKEWGDDHLG